MLPSLSQLPIGASGPSALHDDFEHMYMRRLADSVQPRPNEVLKGRVLDARGNTQHVMDEAERWRQKQLELMRKRYANGTYQLPTHRVDPIPPVQWEQGMEVYTNGALVNVLASTFGVPEKEVSVKDVQSAVRDATGKSSAELARTVRTISDTDGGATLGWWGFRNRLRKAVPALAAVGVVGAGWIVGALYNAYLLKEEAESEQHVYWADWNAFNTASARDARLDKVLIGKKCY